ncbi:MAG TPA: hypothetical protein PLK77_17105 [Pyrinomonadaceae bacterium]|nr:hypothetical protein [Pyrinomonadaceae bacterium]
MPNGILPNNRKQSFKIEVQIDHSKQFSAELVGPVLKQAKKNYTRRGGDTISVDQLAVVTIKREQDATAFDCQAQNLSVIDAR